jgi:hypothetical protein
MFGLVELSLIGGLVLAIVGLAVAIFLPFDRDRDDVMQQIHGDQSRWPQ